MTFSKKTKASPAFPSGFDGLLIRAGIGFCAIMPILAVLQIL